MSTKEKQNNAAPAPEEKTELTLQQRHKRKKMVIFPLFFIAFAGCMWLIFAPSGDKDEQNRDGLNTDLPNPKDNEIVSDKREAYEQEAMQAKQQEKMRSLQDFAFNLGNEETEEERIAREERQLRMAPKPPEYYENPELFENSYAQSRTGAAFQSSTAALQDINRELGSFYEQPAESEETKALQARLDELEGRLAEEQARQSAEAEQLALIEKSYEIAARYMNPEQQAAMSETSASQGTYHNGKAVVQPVKQVHRSIVSLLAAPMPDSVFIEEFTKPRNWGFNTAAGNEEIVDKNSISACIYQTVTVVDGQEVAMRLLEPMMVGDRLIPVNTIITGTARVGGERMGINVNTIQHSGTVIPVELLVHDTDGGLGVFIPGSEEINAFKEIAANMGSGLGSSITITDDAGSQLLADLGRSTIQGASQYINKKMRTVKVTLKAGHRVLLLPPLK